MFMEGVSKVQFPFVLSRFVLIVVRQNHEKIWIFSPVNRQIVQLLILYGVFFLRKRGDTESGSHSSIRKRNFNRNHPSKHKSFIWLVESL